MPVSFTDLILRLEEDRTLKFRVSCWLRRQYRDLRYLIYSIFPFVSRCLAYLPALWRDQDDEFDDIVWYFEIKCRRARIALARYEYQEKEQRRMLEFEELCRRIGSFSFLMDKSRFLGDEARAELGYRRSIYYRERFLQLMRIGMDHWWI